MTLGAQLAWDDTSCRSKKREPEYRRTGWPTSWTEICWIGSTLKQRRLPTYADRGAGREGGAADGADHWNDQTALEKLSHRRFALTGGPNWTHDSIPAA